MKTESDFIRRTFYNTTLLIISIVILWGCTKDTSPTPPTPTPPPVDVCPNLPGIQTNPADCLPVGPPTGTVSVDKTSIGYRDSVTFTFSFRDASLVYIGAELMTSLSGTYTTGRLYKDSTFTIMAVGPTGLTNTLNPITIIVEMDQWSAIVSKGTFSFDSSVSRLLSPDNSSWHKFIPCEKHTFFWGGYHQLPGNKSTVQRNLCSTPSSIDVGWFRYKEPIQKTLNNVTFMAVFYYHGINYDKFEILSERRFRIHEFGLVFSIQGGNLTADMGEYWDYFTLL